MIRDLAEGRSRFCELERSLAGISPRTLSLRLRALEEEGIVARQTYPEVPPRVEYALTEKGRALVPIVESMRVYGREWLGNDGRRNRREAGRRAGRRLTVSLARSPSRSPPRSVPSDPCACNPACAREEPLARGGERAGHAQPRPVRLAGRLRRGGRVAARRGGLRGRGGALRAHRARPHVRPAVLLPPADRPLHRRALARAGQAAVLPAGRPEPDDAARPARLPEGARAAHPVARPPHRRPTPRCRPSSPPSGPSRATSGSSASASTPRSASSRRPPTATARCRSCSPPSRGS